MNFSNIPADKAVSRAFIVQVGLEKINKSLHCDETWCMILQHNTMIMWQGELYLDYCCKYHPLITTMSLDPNIP